MTEGVLIDTCVAIWLADGSPLSEEGAALLQTEAPTGRAYVSAMTAWEMGMLVSRGRVRWAVDPLTVFRSMCDQSPLSILPLIPEILVASSFLPGTPHRDPADRIIIATARHHDLTLLTRDRLILDYGRAGHVSALAC